eukprot:gene8464-8648_t
MKKADDYVYNIPVGAPLEDPPQSRVLLPRPDRFVWNIKITQAPVTYKLTDATGAVITFTAPGYINDVTNQTQMFGPTIKLRAGDTMRIQLTNNLVQLEPTNIPNGSTLYYHNPMDTNLHTHGLHGETGVDNQNTALTYKGGDNVFLDIKARRSLDQAPNVLNFNVKLPRHHMPGIHWYHPHREGATTIQVSTAHGLILVEDDQFWLPWNSGSCGIIFALLRTAPDLMLDITLLFFQQDSLGVPAAAANPTYQWVSGDANNTSTPSFPKNPLCCDSNRTGYAFFGSATQGQGTNILTVNGGFQPVISMYENTWTRMRVLFSGAKGWFVAQILERELATEALANTDRCEIQMIAKDGVYLMKIPRLVPALLLASANRVEGFVKCLAPPAGKTYVLSATNKNNLDPFNPGNNPAFQSPVYRVWQDILAHIKIIKSDEALVKARYPLSNIDFQDVNITSQPTLPIGAASRVGCRIKNELFKFPDPNPIVQQLGKIVEWSYNDVRW